MATTDTQQGCPCCPRAQVAFRVPARYDDALQLTRHYRCGQRRGWIWIHAIATRPPAAMAGVDR